MKLGSCVCIVSVGMASATSAPPERTAAIAGCLITPSSTKPQTRDSRAPLRPRNGIRPLSTRCSSFPSSAGRIDSEPISATATISIAPTAIEVNTAFPVNSIPAMAISTVRPEIRIAWPEVRDVFSNASFGDSPRARSSRSRRR